MITKNYIAIDISKDSLAVATDSFKKSFTYTQAGLKELLKQIKATINPIVVCEATGGYERKLMETLFEQNIPLALLNPARVRAFAHSEGTKAKTDPIDAKMLLRFAHSKDLSPTPVPSKQQQQLQALMDRRSQLTEAIAREKNRLQKSQTCILKSIKKILRVLEKELSAIEQQIQKLIEADTLLAKQNELMQKVKGVGPATAWTILAYLTEITTLKRNQIVALTGIAPFNKDSGKFKGKRRIEGGRAKVRTCLYMAAQTAARFNQHIKEYVDKLKARGKPHKCAMVAAMRKLIIHIQTILKKHQKTIV